MSACLCTSGAAGLSDRKDILADCVKKVLRFSMSTILNVLGSNGASSRTGSCNSQGSEGPSAEKTIGMSMLLGKESEMRVFMQML